MNSLRSNTRNLSLAEGQVSYGEKIAGSACSAAAMVPRILRLFPCVTSVVDVGCGAGTWLHRFRLHGVSRVLGIDDDDPTDGLFQIEKSEYQCRSLSKPFVLDERFDLAMSLEVAQRLSPKYTETFISNLTGLSDVVMFGAAIPGQGGNNHVNERWPGYWAGLFSKQGFACFDVLRGSLWYDERVEWQYRQNTLIFVKKSRADLTASLQEGIKLNKAPFDLVHPRYVESSPAASTGADAPTGDVAMMTAQLDALTTRLESIEQSTSWRAISILQRMVARHPRLRTFIRRSTKLVWWTLSLQFLDKLRERARDNG